MIVAYTALPGVAGGAPRPLLDVSVANLELVLMKCLVDSGATNTLLPRWIAEAAGVDLQRGEDRSFGVGGGTTTARFAVVTLAVGDFTWEADVGFCDPWPYA